MQGAASVEWLRAFMRHWLASLLKIERPDLWQALPHTYALGHRLPAGGSRRRSRSKAPPLPRARWNPERALGHHRWAFVRAAAGAATPRAPRAVPRCQDPLPHEAVHEFPIC